MSSLVFIILAFATLAAPLARCAEVSVQIYAHHLNEANRARYEELNRLVCSLGATSEYAQLKFGPGTYGDGAAFAVGERVRCVAVSTEKSTAAARTLEVQTILQTMPIELDATGAVRATGCLEGAMVVEVPYTTGSALRDYSKTKTEGYVGALNETTGYTGLDSSLGGTETASPCDLWEANVLANSECADKYFYFFVIIEDTRNGAGAPVADTNERVAYGVALVMADMYEPDRLEENGNPARQTGLGGVVTIDWTKFEYTARVVKGGTGLFGDTYQHSFLSPIMMKELALPETLVVGGETYSGEDVEKVLSPALGAWTLTEAGWTLTLATTEAGDVESQIPGVAVPDYLRYTVMTKANLSEDWVPLDKALDNASGNVYTRCRLVDLGSLVLPTVNGDTSRFYKIEQAK